ncbi:hypothetical protein DL767_001461 [Monosporascus sp. MG133]|nr:hypothetical protein DL767_001461 [Monosporascus sp. MG133]
MFLTENDLLVSQVLSLRDSLPDGDVLEDSINIGPSAVSKRRAKEANANAEDEASNGGPASTPSKRVKLIAKNNRGLDDRKLACPFFKRDRHRPHLSRSCMGSSWDTVSRVKEHLYRCHMQPKHQCNRCLHCFGSAAELVDHQRSDEPCERRDALPSETITDDQHTQLKSRAGKKLTDATEEGKWRSMYRIVFPDDEVIPSPYYDEPCSQCISSADSWLLSEYRQYQLRELSPLIQRELAVIPGHEMNDDLRARIADMLPRLNARLFNEFQTSRGVQPTVNDGDQVLSQLGNGPKEIGCTVVQSSLPLPTLRDIWLSHDPLQDDAALEEFKLGIEDNYKNMFNEKETGPQHQSD